MPTPSRPPHAQNLPVCTRRPFARVGLTVALVAAAASASAVVATGNAAAQPTSVTLTPSGDTYVSASSPNTNYGKDVTLRVSNAAGAAKTSYLGFVVPATPGATVTNAELVLRRSGHHLPATTVKVLSVPNLTQNESSLTYANAPTGGSVVATAATTPTTNSLSIDVTGAVKSSGWLVLALTSPVTTGVLQFASREAGATGPQLVLTTAPTATVPPPTTTVAPTTTPTTTAAPTTAPTTTAAPTTTPTTTAAPTTTPTTTAAPTTAPTTTAAPTTAPTTTAPPGPSTSVTAYGAKCDAKTDDQKALQSALDAVKSGSLTFPAGATCVHSAVLRVYNPGITLSGSATLRATNPMASAVEVQAANVTVSGLHLATVGATTRQDAYEQMGLVLLGQSGNTVTGVTIDGPASAGFMAAGASHYTVSGLTVNNSLSDCVHNTYGSSFGTFTNIKTSGCGDDGFAVVSYLNDGSEVHDITVDGFTMASQTINGRGMTVVGGYNVTYSNINVTGSCAAGLYFAAEGAGSYNTYGDNNVQVSNGSLNNSNHCTNIDHGGIVFYNGQPTQHLSNINVQSLTVNNTRATASQNISLLTAGSGGADHVMLNKVTITGGPSTSFYTSGPSGSYDTTGWLVNGKTVPDHVGY